MDDFTTQDVLNQLGTQQPQQPNLNSFGRLVVSIPRMQDLLKGLGSAAMAPVNAAGNILNQGDLLPSQMSINPGREGLIAASAMSPGMIGAEEGLGAAGGAMKMPASYWTQDRVAKMHEALKQQRFREQSGGSNLASMFGAGKQTTEADNLIGKRVMSANDIQDAKTLKDQGVPNSALIDYFGVSKSTFNQRLSEGYTKEPSSPMGYSRGSMLNFEGVPDLIKTMHGSGETSASIADHLQNKVFSGAVEITPSMVRQHIKRMRDKGLLFSSGMPFNDNVLESLDAGSNK